MSAALDLPVIHLDRHFWKPGWVPTEKTARAERVQELANRDAWIMDGNYSGTLDLRIPRAEAVVLLDPPSWRSIARIFKRRFTERHRDDIPSDCPDRIELQFLWWVATYRWRSRPRVMRRLAARPRMPFWVLETDREVDRFVAALGKPTTG